jgi:phosphopantothenoylcysteine decarboxylase/phosphopantothenate--cysteine ligase
MSVSGKKILIAVSGGIAAYKIHFLIRDFVKKGAEVQVIMTPDAEHFVTKLSFHIIKNRFIQTFMEITELEQPCRTGFMGRCNDCCSMYGNTLSKMVHGLCDNLVIATYMSAKCPVFIAPAMDLDMYAHPSTKKNLELQKVSDIYYSGGKR